MANLTLPRILFSMVGATLMLTSTALSDTFTADFNGPSLDPSLVVTRDDPGFSATNASGQLSMAKAAGTTAGYYTVETGFNITGDYTATVDVSIPARQSGLSAGIVANDPNDVNGSDIYFASQNIF